MSIQNENFDDNLNPIDSVEEVLSAHNWVFNRMNDDELMVQVRGNACEYRLFFLWQEDMNAMQLCCQFETPVSQINRDAAAKALLGVNENLWMGHFDLPRESSVPCFRHTCLFHGLSPGGGMEQIEDLVTICLSQCERFFPLFNMLSLPEAADERALQLALMETAGRS